MNNLKKYIDYSKYPIRMIFLYLFCSVLIVLFLNERIFSLLTIGSILVIALSTLLSYFLYYLLRKYVKREKNISKVEFGNYDYNFLSVKIFEILMQQLLIVLILTLGKQHLGENYTIVLLIVFVLLHLQLLLFHSLKFSLFYLVSSIPAILIFIYLYLNFGNLALGIAFLIHLSFYLILGILDLKGKVTKLIGT